jgi:predicted DsbA family dithiol-disulfide isomerase
MASPDNPLRARARAMGLTMVEREWIPSSRRAHECTEMARAAGKLDGFHAAVLESYWSRGEDLHAWDVLERCAQRAGLDGAAMRSEVEAGQWKAAVDERVAQARELGVHAVPTFLVADRFAIEGAQTAETFERVLAQLSAKP